MLTFPRALAHWKSSLSVCVFWSVMPKVLSVPPLGLKLAQSRLPVTDVGHVVGRYVVCSYDATLLPPRIMLLLNAIEK